MLPVYFGPVAREIRAVNMRRLSHLHRGALILERRRRQCVHKEGDTVFVNAGNDKGKTSRVLLVDTKKNRAVVEEREYDH